MFVSPDVLLQYVSFKMTPYQKLLSWSRKPPEVRLNLFLGVSRVSRISRKSLIGDIHFPKFCFHFYLFFQTLEWGSLWGGCLHFLICPFVEFQSNNNLLLAASIGSIAMARYSRRLTSPENPSFFVILLLKWSNAPPLKRVHARVVSPENFKTLELAHEPFVIDVSRFR